MMLNTITMMTPPKKPGAPPPKKTGSPTWDDPSVVEPDVTADIDAPIADVDKLITLRINPELHKIIAELAKLEHRSFNGQATLLLEQSLAQVGKWPPRAKKKDWLK